MKAKQLFTAVRWLAAAVLIYLAYRRALVSPSPTLPPELAEELESSTMPAIPGLLSGIGLMIAGVACIAPELIYWISMPFQAVFNSIFFPGTREIPPPDYNLTRVYREQERYDEALEAYFRILKHHPQELLAYLEGIETAFDAGVPEKAHKLLQAGLHQLPAQELRDQVQRIYDECAARPGESEEPAESEISQISEVSSDSTESPEIGEASNLSGVTEGGQEAAPEEGQPR